jgi:acyl-[acyl-carrier-protein]-phospholipid O-acyltransferase/long-chain-fatty-acid--[acyl-carrier-protein] ligase
MTGNKESQPFKVTIPLLVSQTIGAFNDNAMKAMLPIMAAVQFGKDTMDTVNQQVSILLILPFVLFAPFAGWVTDRFSKKKVITYALFGQLIGLGVLGFALYIKNLEYSLVGFFILSVQSAFFSPAKKGILKELVGREQLGKAVGFMEMLAMVGILGGAFAGANMFDKMVLEFGGWGAALTVCSYVFILAFFSWVISLPIPETSVRGGEPFNVRLLVSHFQDLTFLFKDRGIRYAALGDAWFWGVGSFFYLILVKLSGEVVDGEVGIGSLYGYWFLLVGLGIMLGSIFVAYINRGRIEIGLTPIGALGIPIIYLGLYFSDPLKSNFDYFCFGLGFFGALFFVPLNGYLQDRANEGKRGRILASSNLLTQLFGIILILFHSFLSNFLNLNSKQELLVIFVPALFIGLSIFKNLLEDFFRAWLHMLLRIFYKIQLDGMKNLPSSGGVLIVSNHLSYGDPVFIGAAFSRKVRYLAYSGLANSRLMCLVFRLTETVTVSPEKSLDSIRASVRKLKEGLPLCVFAEGGISRTGTVFPFKRGILLIAKKAGVPILPVYVDGVWGSALSFSRGRFFKKSPICFPYPLSIRAGNLIDSEKASPELVRKRVLELGRQSFNSRMPDEKKAKSIIQKLLSKNPSASFFKSSEGYELTRAEIVKIILLEEEIKSDFPRDVKELINEMITLYKLVSGSLKIWSSYKRLVEINLWDQDCFSVDINSSLRTEWFLWFGLLSQRKIQFNPGRIIISKSEEDTGDVQVITGLSSKANGLISINFKSQVELIGESDELERGYKENSLGRLLPGLCYVTEPTFSVLGIDDGFETFDFIKKVDEGGFLIRL